MVAFVPERQTLFLFCAKGLSSLLSWTCMNRKLTGAKVSMKSVAISHLFSADDSLIFCKANSNEANDITKILQANEQASGQQINIDKSAVLFGKNTTQKSRQEVLQAFRNIYHVTQGKCLGLSMVIGRSKNNIFIFLKKKWQVSVLARKGKCWPTQVKKFYWNL